MEHAKIITGENSRNQESWVEPSIIERWAKAWAGKNWAYTLIVDGVPVVCAGILLQDWNNGEAWALFSSSYKQHKLYLYRMIKAALRAAFHENGLVRIQATIDTQYPENVKWIESLGFEYEGRLRKFGMQGQDYLMYSRLN